MARPLIIGVLVFPLMGVLSACGSSTSTETAASTTQEATVISSSPDPTAGTDNTDQQGSGRAGELLIGAGDLPEGWRDSNPPSSDFRMTVCDVDTEPTPPVDVAQVRFAQTAVGPFLYQYVREYPSAQAPQQVIDALAQALPGCTEFSTRGSAPDSPQASFEVAEPALSQMPDNAVAWRMTPKTENPIIQDVVFAARGTALIAFLSASVGDDPDPAVLEAALTALDAPADEG